MRLRKIKKGHLSLYKSRNQKKQNFTKCGCGKTNNSPKRNVSVPHDQLESDKCNFYHRTRGRRHKLCCGQSKTLRRWRAHNNTLSGGQDPNNLFPNDSEIIHPNDVFPTDSEIFSPTADVFPTDNEKYEQETNFVQSEDINVISHFPVDRNESLTTRFDSLKDTHQYGVLDSLPRNSVSLYSGNILKQPTNIPLQPNKPLGVLENTPLRTLPRLLSRDSIVAQSPSSTVQKRASYKKRKISKIVKKLQDTDLLTRLVTKLDKHKLTKDFVYGIESMANGKLQVNSIPHLAHLDAVRFNRVGDSRKMYYNDKMKRFWHCLYKLAGGPALRLLSGPRGTGDKNFDTASCNINFAVPSLSTLRSMSNNNSKIIHPGILHEVLESIQENNINGKKEFILSFDGKSVGMGLKEDNFGDVNLWNFEMDPNLKEAKMRLESEEEQIDYIKNNLGKSTDKFIFDELQRILKVITERIKDVRSIIHKNKRTIAKYEKMDMENPSYKLKHQYTIHSAQYMVDNCKAIINRCLKVNKDLCQCCANINDSASLFNGSEVINITDQANVKLLIEPHDLTDFFSECDNTVYVKQRTDIWNRIRSMCPVTGSTIHQAIGLGTLSEQKDHHDYFLNLKQKPLPNPDIQIMMDYGTENEVSNY